MLNLFQNDSESGMIPFPEYFIRNLYVHRFRLSSRSADTRRRIVRWLFLHFHVYDYHPADAETTGRYLSRERFQPLLFMTLTEENRRAAAAIFAQMTPGGMIGGYCEEGFPLYFANHEMVKLLGYETFEELSEAIRGKVVNTIHPDDRQRVAADIGPRYYTGLEYTTTYRMPKNGRHLVLDPG